MLEHESALQVIRATILGRIVARMARTSPGSFTVLFFNWMIGSPATDATLI
jgi:hypothetical protein